MVRLENVVKCYGPETVVDSISLTVAKGELLALIGPSGCGKTTLLRMVNRLVPHTSGKIIVNGLDITTVNPVQLRREIGYVIQQIGLLPHLTIAENITFVLELMNTPKKIQNARAEELIQTVGLPAEYLTKYPRHLSGGQQQRIGVARALAANPPVILMDEPFGAVDPITRQQLQEVLLSLQQTMKKTILFVTHDMQEAFKLGSRIALMKAGKIIKIGTSLELLQNDDSYLRQFLGDKAVFDMLANIPVTQVLDPTVPVIAVESPLFPTTAGYWEYAMAVNKSSQFLGILPLQPHDSPAAAGQSIPTPHTASIPPTASITTAIERMLWDGHGWIPVLENGTFIGVVTFESCAGIMRLQRGGQLHGNQHLATGTALFS